MKLAFAEQRAAVGAAPLEGAQSARRAHEHEVDSVGSDRMRPRAPQFGGLPNVPPGFGAHRSKEPIPRGRVLQVR
jgi:hypothetical protein